jgi:HlyD family secretion protein
MRFASFEQKTTPEIEGTVSLVSPDLTQDPRTGVTYYMVRIAVKPNEVGKLGPNKLMPGIPVDVFMKTGARTALSYLTKPLMDQAERAFRER